MSRFLSRVVASLVVIVTGAGCGNYFGSGTPASTTHTVGAFSGISIEGGLMDATVTIGAQQPIEIRGDDNLVPLIQTTVEGGILKVNVSDGPIYPKLPLTVKISTPTLVSVNASGAATVASLGVGAQDHMDITASGGSSVTLNDLTTGAVTLNLSGGSPVTLTGSGTTMNATMSGSLSAKDFPVQTATVDLSGSSTGDITVTDSVSGDVSGTSTLRVYGNPPNRNVNVHSGASVTYP